MVFLKGLQRKGEQNRLVQINAHSIRYLPNLQRSEPCSICIWIRRYVVGRAGLRVKSQACMTPLESTLPEHLDLDVHWSRLTGRRVKFGLGRTCQSIGIQEPRKLVSQLDKTSLLVKSKARRRAMKHDEARLSGRPCVLQHSCTFLCTVFCNCFIVGVQGFVAFCKRNCVSFVAFGAESSSHSLCVSTLW